MSSKRSSANESIESESAGFQKISVERVEIFGERERVCVCVRVCVRERERERERGNEIEM